MHAEGISSLAVVDNNSNVIGNISTVDVQVRRERTLLVMVCAGLDVNALHAVVN